MSSATETSNLPEGTDASEEKVYRHSRRREWGYAILAWDREGRRAFQFEDGPLRVFAQGFESFVEEVDLDDSEKPDVLKALRRLLEINDAAAARAKKSAKKLESPLMVEDQIAAFQKSFPRGFVDPAWLKKSRGAGAKRLTKRHRDPSIAQAQKDLAEERFSELFAQQQYGSVHKAVTDVLQGTDLVSPSQLKSFGELEPGRHQAFAQAVRDLLYGEGSYIDRLGAFADKVRRLTGSRPSWQIVTAIGALVFPQDQVCVSPSAFRDQAKSAAPQLGFKNEPQSSSYEGLLAMARFIGDKLKASGFPPHDMLDVHDFIRWSLAPSARKRAEELRRQRVDEEQRGESEAA